MSLKKTFAPNEPSPVVAQLFHNALLSSNQGPLGPHPRAKPGTGYESFPLVQLGDVFLDSARERAIVVLSADCDLAFSPVDARPPNAETPVILVPGEPKSIMSKIDDQVPAHTEGMLNGDQVYRIDWKFSAYRSVSLGGLREWLIERNYAVDNRDRLRPLYALKLQQEFGAHLFRVGPPVMPPLTFAAEGHVYIFDGKNREKVDDISHGDIMLSHHKGDVVVRMTPKLVDSLRRASINLLRELEDKIAARSMPSSEESNKNVQKKNDADQAKADALKREIENDDFWINLVDGVVLKAPGSLLDKGTACSFVRGSEWQNPNKPRVVLEILENTASALENQIPNSSN